jgi:predicted permease
MKKNYDEALRRVRKRQRAFITIFATYTPAGLLIAPVLAKILPDSINAGFVVFVIWGIAFMVSGGYLYSTRCPRCRKKFFRKWWYHNPFAQHCVHCDLPKNASSDEIDNRRR